MVAGKLPDKGTVTCGQQCLALPSTTSEAEGALPFQAGCLEESI
jgi:hypothetical protein